MKTNESSTILPTIFKLKIYFLHNLIFSSDKPIEVQVAGSRKLICSCSRRVQGGIYLKNVDEGLILY